MKNRLNFLKPVLLFASGVVAGIFFVNTLHHILDESEKRRQPGATAVSKTETMKLSRTTKKSEADLDDVPEDCPGVQSTNAGKASACEGCPNRQICSSGEANKKDPALDEVSKKLQDVKKKILILSGKGGVGKSTISSQLAWLLQEKGLSVGLLDVDICGPSIPLLTGTRNQVVHQSLDGWTPVFLRENFAIMSIGYLLANQDDAVVWRGPKKNGLIKQFLTDVAWGALDILLIDTPPGTSDEHLSLVNYLNAVQIDGALIVTTPQEASLQDVRKEISFCKVAKIPVIGLIENMANSIFDGFNQQQCSLVTETCVKMDVPYLGKIPLDENLLKACENGISVSQYKANTHSIEYIKSIIDHLLNHLNLTLETS